MANVAKPLTELKKDIDWLIEHGRGEEPSVLYMPKLEARRRKQNPEGRVRVQFYVDTATYGRWNEQRDRWIELCGRNPLIAYPLMLDVLAAVPDATVQSLLEAGPIEPNPAVPKASIPRDHIPVEPLSDAAEQADEDFILGRQGLDDA